MSALTNNGNGDHEKLPSVVQNRFISTLVDGMCSQYPSIGGFAERDHTEQVMCGNNKEERERLFESIIHLCFAYELPVHKLLE